MSRGVADATVLIYLAKLGVLDLLDELFDDVLLPETVRREVVDRGREAGYPDAFAVANATDESLHVRALSGETAAHATRLREQAALGAGESAAIALAAAENARCLTDDHAARKTAETLDVPVVGTIYLLLRALESGRFSLEEYVGYLESLDAHGFRMSASLYQQAVEAGEDLGG